MCLFMYVLYVCIYICIYIHAVIPLENTTEQIPDDFRGVDFWRAIVRHQKTCYPSVKPYYPKP